MSLYQELDYFHGSIDINECKTLLLEAGDFLIRSTMDGSDNVLSVAAVSTSGLDDSQSTMARIRSTQIVNEKGGFCLKGCTDQAFPSIKLLVDNYVESKKSVIQAEKVPLIRSIARQDWELKAADVVFPPVDQELGKGSFGKVVKAKYVKNPENEIDVAVKKMNDTISEQLMSEIFREARVMRMFDHSNVIKLYGVVTEKQPIMIVMEYLDGCSLGSALKAKKIPAEFQMSIVAGIVYGLAYVHEKSFIHRDIAARNILISNDFKEVKLIDFGLSRRGQSYMLKTATKIPMRWLPPEAVWSGTFSNKSDVWAFGVTIWEIYNDGAEPYGQKKLADVKGILCDPKQLSANMLFLDNCTTDGKPPAELSDIVKSCFSYNAADRPTMSEIMTKLDNDVISKLEGPALENCKYHQSRRPPPKSNKPVMMSVPGASFPSAIATATSTSQIPGSARATTEKATMAPPPQKNMGPKATTQRRKNKAAPPAAQVVAQQMQKTAKRKGTKGKK